MSEQVQPDLASWLLEQIAEWEVDDENGGCCVVAADDNYPDCIAEMTWHHAKHIATWDPARVLTECEAKRRIVGAEPWWGNDPDEGARMSGWRECHEVVLRLLALPYADRPGYRDEWRP